MSVISYEYGEGYLSNVFHNFPPLLSVACVGVNSSCTHYYVLIMFTLIHGLITSPDGLNGERLEKPGPGLGVYLLASCLSNLKSENNEIL